MKRPKYRCSDCVHWEAKGQWYSTHHPHFAVIAEGICVNTNKTKLNCHYQCTNDFELKTIRGQFQVWKGM